MKLRLLAIVTAICLPGIAHAGWGVPASSCVPDHATIADRRARFGVANVRYAPNNTGPIVLTCAVAPFDPGGIQNWVLSLTYQDSTGTAKAAFVRARLFRMLATSATAEPLAMVISDAEPDTVTNKFTEFTHEFDFDFYFYWVRIDMDRANIDQTVIVHNVGVSVLN